jgi:phage shock protein PspC (stress-responsive transcriptional regulator)
MHDHRTPLFARDDTMLGACHGLGDELGISPAWFRVALALGLFWNWAAVLTGYVAVALVMNLLHWRFPLRRQATPKAASAAPSGDNDDAVTALAEAA